MQEIVRQASEPLELRRAVEIAGQRNDAMRAQHIVALRRMGQGIEAVAPGKQLHHAQRDIPAADDQESSHPAILVELEVSPASRA